MPGNSDNKEGGRPDDPGSNGNPHRHDHNGEPPGPPDGGPPGPVDPPVPPPRKVG